MVSVPAAPSRLHVAGVASSGNRRLARLGLSRRDRIQNGQIDAGIRQGFGAARLSTLAAAALTWVRAT